MAREQKKIRVNFGDVDPEIRKHQAKFAKVPEGDYLVKIVEGQVRTSESKGSKYIFWRAQVVKPAKYAGKPLPGMTSLKKEALWNLRNLINAAFDKNVAGQQAVSLDLDKFRNKVVGAAVEDDEYDGNIRSRINTWFPEDEYEEPEDEDDEMEEDDEDLEEDEDEEDEEDEDEEDEEPVVKKRKAKAKTTSRKRRPVDDEDEDEEELEEVDVEEI